MSFLLPKSRMHWPREQGTCRSPHPTREHPGDHVCHFCDIKLHPAVLTHTGELGDLRAAMTVSFCKSCMLGQSCPPRVTPARPDP